MAEQLQEKIIYPPGVRELTPDISTDDFVRRLKECAQAFQNMIQEEDNTAYIPLGHHLASELFLEHRSQDVRLIAACCLADFFRIFAPDAPFTDLSHVKVIFYFFIEQLNGLRNPNSPSFKRYFYLLENFACVRTFNFCAELDNCKDIFHSLFKLMFQIISDILSNKVKGTILDMLTALLSETEVVHQEVLDLIFLQVIEPIKSNNKNACLLAADLLRRSSPALEPYIQNFFNNALFLPRSTQSVVSRHLFDLIYELNTISSSLMSLTIPQLEYKLKSSSLDERLQVAKLVARMFADKQSKMIIQNQSLWSCFLARFNDIDPQVRILCSEFSKPILLNHPEAKDDLTEQLKQRSRDPNEDVRYAVVMSILGAAKESFSSINQELLSSIKERTLDKKFRIRKEALLGLARLYKQHSGIGSSSELLPADMESITWIKNKILHVYYQNSVNDKLLVERIMNTCLVPYQKPMNERMKMLYKLFCTVDDNAARAFTEILKCQKNMRTLMESVLVLIQRNERSERENIHKKISQLTKHFQDPAKCNPLFLKFFSSIQSNAKLRTMLAVILRGNITSAEAENKVKGILKTLGNPVQTNVYYLVIKQLLESVAPVMLDKEGLKQLVMFVKDSLLGDGAIEAELGLQNSAKQGLQLLLVLSYTLPLPFQSDEVYSNLMSFLHNSVDEWASDTTLQILTNISNGLEEYFPEVCRRLLPLLLRFVKTGNPKQAKHAVYCLHNIVSDQERIFGEIVSKLRRCLTIESVYCRTALVSIGHIAYLCHDMFARDFKEIVTGVVVHKLLMAGDDFPDGDDDEEEEANWVSFENVSSITKIKIAGMKFMTRWLIGLRDMVKPAQTTLTLFTTLILQGGMLEKTQKTRSSGKSWIRLTAAFCVLKLCHEPLYAAAVPLNQFQVLASLMYDPCFEVRERFVQKLHKGLVYLKLPLEFLTIMSLSALDSNKEFRAQVKKMLITCINKRRAYIKDRNLSNDDLAMHLPDNALQYAVHLLAHSPFFKEYNDISALEDIRECLNLLLETLMFKNEDYSYAFFKRLLENIKQTKDVQNPEDKNTNLKMYAVCDLGLNIIMSKSNFILKDFPAEPTLNSRFFTDVDKSYSNMLTYLPAQMIAKAPVRAGFDIVPYVLEDKSTEADASNSHSKPTKAQTKPKSKVLPKDATSTSVEESPTLNENSTFDETDSSEHSLQHVSKNSDNGETNSESSDLSPPGNRNTTANSMNDCEMEEGPLCDSVNSNSKHISKNSNSVSCSKRNNVSRKRKNIPSANDSSSPKKTRGVNLRSSRSLSSNTSTSLHSCVNMPVAMQNGTASNSIKESDFESFSDYSHLIKECSVYLQRDVVENYAALHYSTERRTELLGSDDTSSASSSINSLTDENIPKRSTRSTRKTALKVKSTSALNKRIYRKRDLSQPSRSVRGRPSNSSRNNNSMSTKYTTNSPLKEIMELQQSKANSNYSTASSDEANTSIKSLKSDLSPSIRFVRGRTTSSSQNASSPNVFTSSKTSIETFIKNGRPLKEIKALQHSKNGLNHISESSKKAAKKVNKEQIDAGDKDSVTKSVNKTVKSNQVSQTRSTRRNQKNELNAKRSWW